jgi:hypothetical protein
MKTGRKLMKKGQPDGQVPDLTGPHQRCQPQRGRGRPDQQSGDRASGGGQAGPPAATSGVAQYQQAVRPWCDHKNRRHGYECEDGA